MTPKKPAGDGRTAAATAKWQRSKRLRISSGLVGLSSAAIVSVYTVGYARTQAAEDQLTAAVPAAVVAQAPAQTNGRAPGPLAPSASSPTPSAARPNQVAPTSTPSTARPQQVAPTSTPSAARPQQAAPTAAPRPTQVAAQGGYRDGTYVGSGNSRHGGVAVTVVVAGGKITSAQITNCQTRYPCSKISSLPGQVIARQSAQVNYVSGATDSSTAYRQAVANALAQAT
jgi:uncharacterized protein with FMN-binding domain